MPRCESCPVKRTGCLRARIEPNASASSTTVIDPARLALPISDAFQQLMIFGYDMETFGCVHQFPEFLPALPQGSPVIHSWKRRSAAGSRATSNPATAACQESSSFVNDFALFVLVLARNVFHGGVVSDSEFSRPLNCPEWRMIL